MDAEVLGEVRNKDARGDGEGKYEVGDGRAVVHGAEIVARHNEYRRIEKTAGEEEVGNSELCVADDGVVGYRDTCTGRHESLSIYLNIYIDIYISHGDGERVFLARCVFHVSFVGCDIFSFHKNPLSNFFDRTCIGSE